MTPHQLSNPNDDPQKEVQTPEKATASGAPLDRSPRGATEEATASGAPLDRSPRGATEENPLALSTSPEGLSYECREELWSHVPSEAPAVAYIYDSKKGLGFACINGLYRHINKHFLQRYPIPTIERDLRPIMDLLPSSHIPVAPCNLLNLSTGQVRPRTPEDYVTYELPTPRLDPSVEAWMSQLGPTQDLRMYLFQFLQGQGPPYVILIGPGVSRLFEALALLKPLIGLGDRRLYTEMYARRKMLQEISQCRIVLVNIGDRTLRVADFQEFQGILPIQYHGLVQVQSISQTQSLFQSTPNGPTLTFSGIPSEITFGVAELLGWIISPI